MCVFVCVYVCVSVCYVNAWKEVIKKAHMSVTENGEICSSFRSKDFTRCHSYKEKERKKRAIGTQVLLPLMMMNQKP